jgi:hypothetical protein
MAASGSTRLDTSTAGPSRRGVGGDYDGYGHGYGQMMSAPEPPRRDWRDLFVSPALSTPTLPPS